MKDESRWWDATEVAQKIAAGDVTPSEVVEAAIARIEEGEPHLNAVSMRWFDHGREVAASAPSGLFGGVPFLLKDLWVQYAGMGRTDGNVALAATPPISTIDSVLVSRFKAAGLVTLGRSTSPEMGSIPATESAAHGDTRNPWDTARSPGGSSGGAAAAVAAGYVPIAHASDGGGSIRVPASWTGLVGLKTSQGRITMQGHGIESGLGVDGCVSHTVRDTARFLDAVHGPGVGDTIIAPAPSHPYVHDVGRDVGSLKVGMLDTHPQGSALHPDCVAAVHNTMAALAELGHRTGESHPDSFHDTSLTSRFMAMWVAGRRVGLSNMGNAIGRELTEAEVEPQNWAMAQQANDMTAWEYADALAAVATYRREMQQWWADGWDILVTPTMAEPAPMIGEMVAQPGQPLAGVGRALELCPFTPPFNTTGQPAISLPLHRTAGGLPVGVQLVAAYGREDLLIAVASQLEQAMPWVGIHPTT